MANPAAVPLSLLVIVVLNLLSLPVYNVISRHMEAGGRLEGARDDARPGAGGEPLQGVHDPVAERPRPADVVVPALRQPPLRRAADRDGRGLAQRNALGQRVLGAGAALGRRQPAALGGDRAALDAVRRVHVDVHHPVAVVGAEPRRPAPGTCAPRPRPGLSGPCAGSGCGWAGRRASGCRRGRRTRACRT